ncbi:S41 family peptidase [Acidaminobacter sp. JC074]|uniref:S41 family peptidase n=1 Tax=Acidaminobacter sp. JC074 TaxID=2530199 RepID=UPI001F0F089B|nr:S41 family peptidase [Acidaminobacter sp. JC074]MCH4889572.1 S41 family peptidase [Acidaminobacter sp. JC074]
MKLKKSLLPFVLGVLVTLAIGMVLITTEHAVLISSIKYDRLLDMDKKYEKAEKIKEEILEEFYQEISEEELEIGMYRGMFEATGDKYSRYFTEEELEAYHDSTNGNYVGIGVLSDVSEGDIHITRVFPESPAEKAGILAGDFIIEVDGVSIEDSGYEKLIDIMLGEEGTDIEVIVNRDEEIMVFNLQRGRVDIPFISSKNLDGIGYIHIYQFGTDVSKEFKDHLKSLQKEGIRGLILDVRDNPGGLVAESTDIADMLMKDGLIIYTLDNEDNRRTYKSDASSIDIPVVCIANEKSASASEILIGALQDSESAVIVGEQSFGKGIVQGITNLTDGTGYKITYSQYFTPNDNVIHQVGVTPDYIVPFEGSINILDPNPEQDPQLDKAIEVMEELMLSK